MHRVGWDAGAVVYQISAVFSGFLRVFFRLALCFSSFPNQGRVRHIEWGERNVTTRMWQAG